MTATLRHDARQLIGHVVRSFDFDGRDLEGDLACYVTGTVIGIIEAGELADDGETVFNDCDRYIIAGVSHTFSGKEKLFGLRHRVFPPLNGTPMWSGETTNGVVRIEPVEQRRRS